MDNQIKKTDEKLRYISVDEEALALYEAREEAILERNSMISSAKKEGREEAAENIAKKLINKGFSIGQVIEITGLTKEKVEKFLKNNI